MLTISESEWDNGGYENMLFYLNTIWTAVKYESIRNQPVIFTGRKNREGEST